jgi:Zn-dependent protease with chaperone function
MKIRKKLSLGAFLLLYPFLSFSQFSSGYKPLGRAGAIPREFLFDPVSATQQNIKSTDQLSESEAAEFYTSVNYLRKRLFESGNLYLDNEISVYISSIVSRLQASNPQIKGDFKVYLSRSVEPNATCLADGSIFVNIGLLSVLENESQLAFVLAHEIAHYLKQHSVKDFKRLTTVTQYETQTGNQYSNLFRKLKISRESEFDADGFAIQLMLQSEFDAREASAALLKLDSRPSANTKPVQIDFNKYFKNAHFTYDTAWVSKKEIEKARKGYNTDDNTDFVTDEVVDLYKSHPDIDKRVTALTEIILNSETAAKTQKADNKDYAHIRQLALFETIESNLQNANYVNAAYFAMRQLEQYPENSYLYTAIAKSFYWISYFKEINEGKLAIKEPLIIPDDNFFWLYTLLKKTDIPQTKKLSYSFAKITSERFKESEPALFYLGLTTENYLGKNAAYAYYSKYLAQYPQGSFTPFVKSKLN